jgi:uncharacterized phiE125 gp8 family phage protein
MKNLQVRIKTDLTTEPVTSAEAKLWCKVTGSTEDSVFTILITSARQALEKYTACSFAEKTIHATWVEMPEDNELELPYGPVISVDKIYKIDEEGTEEELVLNTDYHVYGDQDAIVKVASFWSSGIKSERSVRVEYKAGYGNASTETLPVKLKECILNLVNKSYTNRGDEQGMATLDNDIKREAASYRKHVWL